eukprot:CAMPEP_0174385482 /NCGR_PEP_ID=MMETSP0811_2-20130205/126627_1 /TAXON_ID=73025 ORGANISM="Eutreptiella gymnastica-like, Strain CCMP1594" /NCGR_SAMPLE_ID=MMETSP0811_2 /ASSEMBLY_ACC=CAM_ASM_000667 /LENGTH=69 /DNA_ID=CAMNT_0015539811 /DNA_START=803 /DNA_END=1012 /DNA_ORIENTATION=+
MLHPVIPDPTARGTQLEPAASGEQLRRAQRQVNTDGTSAGYPLRYSLDAAQSAKMHHLTEGVGGGPSSR